MSLTCRSFGLSFRRRCDSSSVKPLTLLIRTGQGPLMLMSLKRHFRQAVIGLALCPLLTLSKAPWSCHLKLISAPPVYLLHSFAFH